jgi:hypothetical protein
MSQAPPRPPRPTTAGRGISVKRLVAIVVVVSFVPALIVAWFILWPANPARFVAIIDSLPVPATWEPVHTYERGPGFLVRTEARRYYLVDADSEDLVQRAKDVVTAAGFSVYVDTESPGWCDDDFGDGMSAICPTKVRDDCRVDFIGGPADCSVRAYRELEAEPQSLDQLRISLSPRGTTFDFGDGRHGSDPARSLVMISADRATRSQFWSSPTPVPSGG